MPKLKILFEAGPLIDSQKSGVGHYIASFVASLDRFHRDDLEITGYFFNFLNHKYKPQPKIGNIRFRIIKVIPGKFLATCRRFGVQPFLECFISPRDTDVVLYTNYVSLPLLHRRKQALVVYDLSFWDHPEFTQAVNLAFLRRFFRSSVRRADLIVTISDFTKQRLRHYFPDLKAEIIVTPIPPNAPAAQKKNLSSRLAVVGIKTNHYILHVGTLEPRKNLQNLIQAYTLLSDELRTDQALVLAGGKGWKDSELLKTIQELKSQGYNIIMTGYVSESEKSELYSNASCVVMPSHYEGFGMPILEALQYGVPVAVSDIPVFHEIAGEAALYFDKNMPGDITLKIAELLTNTTLRRRLVSKAARQLASFSWEDNANRVCNAFQKLKA